MRLVNLSLLVATFILGGCGGSSSEPQKLDPSENASVASEVEVEGEEDLELDSSPIESNGVADPEARDLKLNSRNLQKETGVGSSGFDVEFLSPEEIEKVEKESTPQAQEDIEVDDYYDLDSFDHELEGVSQSRVNDHSSVSVITAVTLLYGAKSWWDSRPSQQLKTHGDILARYQKAVSDNWKTLRKTYNSIMSLGKEEEQKQGVKLVFKKTNEFEKELDAAIGTLITAYETSIGIQGTAPENRKKKFGEGEMSKEDYKDKMWKEAQSLKDAYREFRHEFFHPDIAEGKFEGLIANVENLKIKDFHDRFLGDSPKAVTEADKAFAFFLLKHYGIKRSELRSRFKKAYKPNN